MNQADHQVDRAPRFIHKFLFVLGGQRRRLFLMTIFFFTLSILDLCGVGLIGPFIAAILDPTRLERYAVLRDVISSKGWSPRQQLELLGSLLFAVFVAKGLAAFLIHHQIFAFSYKVKAGVIKKLMTAYLHMPYSFYLERNSASIIQSVVIHTKSMSDDMLIPALKLLSDSVMLITLGLFLLWVSPTAVFLLSCILGTAFLLYFRFVRPRLRAAGEAAVGTNERIIRGINHGIGGIKEIRIHRVEQTFLSEVSEAAEQNSRAHTTFNSLLVVPRYLMETMIVLFVVLFSLYVTIQTGDGQSLIPILAMFGVAGLRILPAAIQVSSSLASMHYAAFSLNELYRDLKEVDADGVYRPPTPQPLPKSGSPKNEPTPFETLALSNIRFSYPKTMKRAVDGISLTVNRGQCVGFIGESGAGKTTLVDILLGLHTFDSGRFDVNGVSIDEYGWERWLAQTAYIPQNAFLTDDTLARNVAFGIPESKIDHRRLEVSLADAQLSALVQRLPDGINTVLGERGVRLSGGERQRVALARAFYHNRDVFVFDEATSALDGDTEKQIIDVIESLHGEKTLIVVAHRMTTVRCCDVIYRLQLGKISMSGRFAEVCRENVG